MYPFLPVQVTQQPSGCITPHRCKECVHDRKVKGEGQMSFTEHNWVNPSGFKDLLKRKCFLEQDKKTYGAK